MKLRKLPLFLTILIFIFLVPFYIIESSDTYAAKGGGKITGKSSTEALNTLASHIKNPSEHQTVNTADVPKGQKGEDKFGEQFVSGLKDFYRPEFRGSVSSSVDKFILNSYADLSNILIIKLIVGLPYLIA